MRADAEPVAPMNSPRPDWLARRWWTADRVSRAGLVLLVLALLPRTGGEDEVTARTVSHVLQAVSTVVLVVATVLYVRERRRRRELTPPSDRPGR